MDNNDWDLFAIVRSCKASTSTPHDTISENSSPPPTTTTTNTNNIIANATLDRFTIPAIVTDTNPNPNTFIPIPTTIIHTFNITSPTNNKTTITPIYATTTFTTPNLTSIIRTTTTTPTTTTIPSINTNTTSSPTVTMPIFSTIPIPKKITSITNTITNTNTSFHNSNQSSTFFDIPTLIEQQLMQPNELIELEKSKPNFNLNAIIPIPTTNMHTFNIATSTTNNTTITPIYTTSTLTIPTPITTTTIPATTAIPSIFTNTTSTPTIFIPCFSTTSMPTNIGTTTNMITPIYTTNTFTTPTPTSTICTHTTTIAPTMNNTNISVQGTNQYPTIYDFTLPIKQKFQPNNNQVFSPKHITHIEIASAHFDRTYNQLSAPQQLPRGSNQLALLPQINSHVLSNTHPQEPKHKSRKRKNNNQMTLEDRMIEENAKEDSWTWIKYGQKPISGSPHSRSYYKCNSFIDCPARKLVEKSKTKENTYVVTYKRDHSHKKPTGNLNSIIGTSWNKSSETRLPATWEAGSSSNVGNFHFPNKAVLQFDQPECSNTRVIISQSKIPCQKIELIKSRLHATGEARSSANVSNLGLPNVMMLQFDEPKSNGGQIFAGESDTKFTGSLDDDDDDDDDAILIEKMKTMLENFLLEFNDLRALFP